MAKTNAAQKMQEIAESGLPPKQAMLKALGAFKDQVLHSQVLVMTYVQPLRTAGGIILTSKTIEEDRFQGKVGLVIAKGPGAFVDQGEVAKFFGTMIEVGDWVLTRPADGMELFFNGCSLRLFQDVNILAKVAEPAAYY